MNGSIIARVSDVRFKQNDMKHTVYYAEHCTRLAESMCYPKSEGNLKAVLAETEEEAAEKIAEQLREWMRIVNWGDVDPNDFTFSFSFTKIDEDGLFWMRCSTTNCKQYPVAKEAA